MQSNGQEAPGFVGLTAKVLRTGVGLLRNRGELLATEWQQEKARLAEILLWTAGFLFFCIMAVVLATGTILLLVPGEWRLVAVAALFLLYGLGALLVWMRLRSRLRKEPFAASIEQLKKDSQWLHSSD